MKVGQIFGEEMRSEMKERMEDRERGREREREREAERVRGAGACVCFIPHLRNEWMTRARKCSKLVRYSTILLQ